jgi:hypothetical protein
LTKEPKKFVGEKIAPSTNGAEISACKRLKLDPCLSSYTNINSRGIKDFNVSSRTMKLP